MEYDWRKPERVAPWKPRQRFRVTASGEGAALRYRAAVEAAQVATDPRSALERAKRGWAAGLELRPGDGILLEEMTAGRASLAELQPTLEALSIGLRDARGTLDRLVAARLVEPLEIAGAPSPPRRPVTGGGPLPP